MKPQSSAQTWTWTLDFDLGFVNSWNQIDSRKFLRMNSGPLLPTENLGLCKSTLLDWSSRLLWGRGWLGWNSISKIEGAFVHKQECFLKLLLFPNLKSMSWTWIRVRNNLLRNCALLYVGLLYFSDRSQLECMQHRVFLCCNPRTSMLLNFSDRTRTCVFNMIWP